MEHRPAPFTWTDYSGYWRSMLRSSQPHGVGGAVKCQHDSASHCVSFTPSLPSLFSQSSIVSSGLRESSASFTPATPAISTSRTRRGTAVSLDHQGTGFGRGRLMITGHRPLLPSPRAPQRVPPISVSYHRHEQFSLRPPAVLSQDRRLTVAIFSPSPSPPPSFPLLALRSASPLPQ